MKRIIITLLLIAMFIAVFTGCGNMSLGLGNFTYEKVHVDTHNYSGCFTVEKWFDGSGSAGIEVKTREAGSMFLSEGMYIMLGGDTTCPFCESIYLASDGD